MKPHMHCSGRNMFDPVCSSREHPKMSTNYKYQPKTKSASEPTSPKTKINIMTNTSDSRTKFKYYSTNNLNHDTVVRDHRHENIFITNSKPQNYVLPISNKKTGRTFLNSRYNKNIIINDIKKRSLLNDLGHFKESARNSNVSRTHASRRSEFVHDNFVNNPINNVTLNNYCYNTNRETVVESKNDLIWYNSAFKRNNNKIHNLNVIDNITTENKQVEVNEMVNDNSSTIHEIVLDSCIGNSVVTPDSTFAVDEFDAKKCTNIRDNYFSTTDNTMCNNSILSRGTNKISSTEDILGNSQEYNNVKMLDSGLFLNNTIMQTQQSIQHNNMSKNTTTSLHKNDTMPSCSKSKTQNVYSLFKNNSIPKPKLNIKKVKSSSKVKLKSAKTENSITSYFNIIDCNNDKDDDCDPYKDISVIDQFRSSCINPYTPSLVNNIDSCNQESESEPVLATAKKQIDMNYDVIDIPKPKSQATMPQYLSKDRKGSHFIEPLTHDNVSRLCTHSTERETVNEILKPLKASKRRTVIHTVTKGAPGPKVFFPETPTGNTNHTYYLPRNTCKFMPRYKYITCVSKPRIFTKNWLDIFNVQEENNSVLVRDKNLLLHRTNLI